MDLKERAKEWEERYEDTPSFELDRLHLEAHLIISNLVYEVERLEKEFAEYKTRHY